MNLTDNYGGAERRAFQKEVRSSAKSLSQEHDWLVRLQRNKQGVKK